MVYRIDKMLKTGLDPGQQDAECMGTVPSLFTLTIKVAVMSPSLIQSSRGQPLSNILLIYLPSS